MAAVIGKDARGMQGRPRKAVVTFVARGGAVEHVAVELRGDDAGEGDFARQGEKIMQSRKGHLYQVDGWTVSSVEFLPGGRGGARDRAAGPGRDDAGVRAEVGRLLAVLPGAEVRDEDGRDFSVVAWGPGGEVLAAVVREGLVTASLTLRHADDQEAFRGFLAGMAARERARNGAPTAEGVLAGEVVLFDAEGREVARLPAYGDGRGGLITSTFIGPLTVAYVVVLPAGGPPRLITLEPGGGGGFGHGVFVIEPEGSDVGRRDGEKGT